VPTLTQVLERPARQASPVSAAPALAQARLTIVTPEFEASVRAHILADLKTRIDAVIDERLYRDLEPLVTSVMETFSARLQDQVRRTLGDVVAQAVEQAIAEEERRSSAAR
jgi:hypothetical protein